MLEVLEERSRISMSEGSVLLPKVMSNGGSQIDFEEKMIGSQFTIGNPNATSSCSCGASFAV